MSLPPGAPLLLPLEIGRCNQVKMRFYRIRAGSSPMTGVFIRRKSGVRPTGRHRVTTGGRDGGMQPQAEGCWQPPDAEQIPPQRFQNCQRRCLADVKAPSPRCLVTATVGNWLALGTMRRSSVLCTALQGPCTEALSLVVNKNADVSSLLFWWSW